MACGETLLPGARRIHHAFLFILATCYSLLDTDSMSVGLLIITHERIGADLLNTAIALLGVRPLNAQVLGVPLDSDPDQAVDAARQRISRLDLGDGVLVLTDLFGAIGAYAGGGLKGMRSAAKSETANRLVRQLEGFKR